MAMAERICSQAEENVWTSLASCIELSSFGGYEEAILKIEMAQIQLGDDCREAYGWHQAGIEWIIASLTELRHSRFQYRGNLCEDLFAAVFNNGGLVRCEWPTRANRRQNVRASCGETFNLLSKLDSWLLFHGGRDGSRPHEQEAMEPFSGSGQ